MSSKAPAKGAAKGGASPRKPAGAAKTTGKAPAKTTKAGGSSTTKTTAAKPKTSKTTAAAKTTKEAEKVEVDPGQTELFEKTIPLTELANLVVNENEELRSSGKSPFIIDPNGAAATFFRYRNVNNLDAMNSNDMQTERIRLAIIGGIRYGKPTVVIVPTPELFDEVCRRVNEVHDGLIDMLLDQSILKDEKFMCLVKEEDGQEYQPYNFNDTFTSNFRFIMVTTDPGPPKRILDKFFVVRLN